MQAQNIERGRAAEQLAKAFLKKRKLSAVTSNYRTRFGEIDLIMRDGDTLVFVEVRYRHSKVFGSAAESVGRDKQARIIRAAQEFLQTHQHDGAARFDVVAFDGTLTQAPTWTRNAFEAEW